MGAIVYGPSGIVNNLLDLRMQTTPEVPQDGIIRVFAGEDNRTYQIDEDGLVQQIAQGPRITIGPLPPEGPAVNDLWIVVEST